MIEMNIIQCEKRPVTSNDLQSSLVIVMMRCVIIFCILSSDTCMLSVMINDVCLLVRYVCQLMEYMCIYMGLPVDDVVIYDTLIYCTGK